MSLADLKAQLQMAQRSADARVVESPEPGQWMIRLVKNGPEVPARIVRWQTKFEPGNPSNLMDRPAYTEAYIAGKRVSPDRVWHRRGRSISLEEYFYQIKLLDYVQEHDPANPKAEPRRPVNIRELPPILPPTQGDEK